MTGSASAADEGARLDAGTYEVLRSRLTAQAAALREGAAALNGRRTEVFGGSELRLVGTERIRTENHCVPRDIVAVGGVMLFGYNVFVGMRPETAVSDVFSAHAFARDGDRFAFTPTNAPLLAEPGFVKDFGDLYRYYRDTRLTHLRLLDGKLLAVFQTGTDQRVLRWTSEGAYLDNRGERDNVYPPAFDFDWVATTRADHVEGRHPHISIQGEVFVETVGGDLTIKIENNTETGAGVYSEPVDEPLQSLADADISYARVGALILLRIRPYNEEAVRHLVFNTRTKSVVRLDGIGQACRRLPEDHGIIFPGGYYLETDVVKTFDTATEGLEFERLIKAGNGEDVMYVFHARAEGRTLLLPYNVIRKEVATPIVCHGYSLFDDGTLIVFRADTDEPTRSHPMQIWETPFKPDEAAPVGSGPLERIGNADLVRGISDCMSVARMAAEMTPTSQVFEALIAACVTAADNHHWLGEHGLAEPLEAVRTTAAQVLEEFESVREMTARAAEAVESSATEIAALVRRIRGEAPASADDWVARLAALRAHQGHLVTLRELRYVDAARLDSLAEGLAADLASAAQRAVEFLGRPEAFDGYRTEVRELAERAAVLESVAEAAPVAERLSGQAAALESVTEIVGSLEFADATVRTGVLAGIGEVLGGVNRARAILEGRRRDLLEVEGRAAFAAEFTLLGQSVTAALASASSPEACDEQLGKLLLQIETLESRFAEFDDFLGELAAKREDVYEAFSSRKQALLDERTRRADRLVASADRVLGGVARRVAGLGSLEEVNTFFATDAMVAKLTATAAELRELGDPVRADELDGRVKAARQEAGRALRDRLDLFEGDTIKLGEHRFTVDDQPTELTLVPHDGGLAFTVTGTDYRSPVTDPAFADTRQYWTQSLVSETDEVYRAEFLAASLLDQVKAGDALADKVREAAVERYDEGYERGVHDHDAALILERLVELRDGAGLLRFGAPARAAAQLFWAHRVADDERDGLRVRAASLVSARALFGTAPALADLAAELAGRIGGPHAREAGEYLVEELAEGSFVTGKAARELLDGFHRTLGSRRDAYTRDLAALPGLREREQLVTAWLEAYVAGKGIAADDLPEAVALELCPDLPRRDAATGVAGAVEGLLGTHPRISRGSLELRLDEFLTRTRRFTEERVPGFRAYQRRRNELVEHERERLRLSEFQPKVMSAFVRNRLLDEVYLPLIGANLAKQLGAAGAARRTDQMGMLLLISPPGYGKTTLMEYVASRLGMVFVKVNGPALGHEVTSLDPADAPNATARQEVDKINFGLEMGNNVLLYLDDIQHTSPELLQKFISLCDAQRRIEGVWNGRTKTYDMRGKRFAVCMAGNPYTESGQRFKIPDMLANRADVWNLGDVLAGRDEVFALSYIENALTSNAVLAPLSTRDRGDVELLVRMAAGDAEIRADRLAHPYGRVELEQILAVLRKMLKVQEVVLANNRAYIASAAQADSSRVEPRFQLQGSYRNMNKLAERIVPVLNDAELDALINDHYIGEAQTLTTGAEANLLKLAELRGTLTPEQDRRWTDVKAAFLRARALGASEDDPMSRAVGALGLLADRLAAIQTTLEDRP
ncbi:DNA repair ATPase [Actinocorallia sp. A-T 12471]|uniref:DNA repair ATPase n=1 Tax=Actinocorallia sp. A-T 12471 TaxID=3089813 RepID=UPI0029CDD64D|nr:DNA repair ATPase [Actinocorallia sp. A-T 12471]MDX6738163.1 DNA repair ATPase [Actinocorallia sp. A-T 12471]